MTPLSPLDLELLNFLCAAHHHRCRVTRIKGQRQASLKRLRYAGLVSFEGFIPSPSATADWLARRNETPAGSKTPEPTVPPAPKAVDEGGGADARKAGAPPPTRKAPPSMAERARRFEEQRNTQGTSGTARKAPGAAESTAATRIKDRAPTKEPSSVVAPPATARPVDIKVNTRRDPTQPPDTPLMNIRDAQVSRGYRHAAAVNRGHEQAATALVDAGVDPASQNSITSARMRAVLARRAEETRLACPIEQAKTKLRRRYAPVCGAEVNGGPAGKFYVGRKLVTEAELLAMAAGVGA